VSRAEGRVVAGTGSSTAAVAGGATGSSAVPSDAGAAVLGGVSIAGASPPEPQPDAASQSTNAHGFLDDIGRGVARHLAARDDAAAVRVP
jgi:hypothetical protein